MMQEMAPSVGMNLSKIEGDDVLHVIWILDRSGSMSGQEADVIGGFNSYIDGLRAEPHGPVGVSYIRFDNVAELVWNDVPLADVPRMTANEYCVRGSTALLDAFGMTVSAVKPDAAHSYVVITHTDGEENSSREWTAEKVTELMKAREADGNWTFAFFGEGIDAWAQARDYGFAQSSTASWAPAMKTAAFAAERRVTNTMRGRRMRSSKNFGAAVDAAMKDATLSDDDIAKVLTGDAGEHAPSQDGA